MKPHDQFKAEVEAHPPLQISRVAALADRVRKMKVEVKAVLDNLKAKQITNSGGEKSGGLTLL